MFELKKEKVEIVDENGNKAVYEVGPLTGEYLEDMYYVMDKLQKAGEDENEILKVLGTDAVKKLHNLIFVTLKNSYPDQDELLLNQFASQNLIKFLQPIISINMPSN
jgi:hypothetical protein